MQPLDAREGALRLEPRPQTAVIAWSHQKAGIR
jgi:hypothetical protein